MNDTHAVLSVPSDKLDAVKAMLGADFPSIRIMATGEDIEIYKEVGYPTDVAERFDLAQHDRHARASATRAWRPRSAVTTLGAHPFSTGADECLVHNGSLSNHNNLRRELDSRRHDLRDRERHRGRRRLSHLAHERRALNLGEALEKSLDDLDGFFTFVVGTKNGFGVRARPDRLQAGRHGRDRPIRRLRLRIPRARRPARHRQGEGLGARARNRLLLGALMQQLMRNSCVRRSGTDARCANSTEALHRQTDGTNEAHWEVLNPRGRHAVAVGVDAPINVDIKGSVGYYCAGMNKQATVTVHGTAGPGVAENMMSGKVVIKGDASQYAGATGRGGLLVIEGNASSRCGISMKGIDIVVKGNIGHMSAFMAQSGNLVVLGDAGDALGDSIYEARLFVRGTVKSLGADCIEKEMRPEHHESACGKLLEEAGINGRQAQEFRRYGSARKLYNFNIDNADAY